MELDFVYDEIKINMELFCEFFQIIYLNGVFSYIIPKRILNSIKEGVEFTVLNSGNSKKIEEIYRNNQNKSKFSFMKDFSLLSIEQSFEEDIKGKMKMRILIVSDKIKKTITFDNLDKYTLSLSDDENLLFPMVVFVDKNTQKVDTELLYSNRAVDKSWLESEIETEVQLYYLFNVNGFKDLVDKKVLN